MQNKLRPKFLELFTLAPKMAITAKVSILHRISGFLLFLSIPCMIYILHKSLTQPNFYSNMYTVMSLPLIKILYVVLMAAFIYHMCAGGRFLFLDMDKGVEIKTAKKTSYIVLVVSLILSIILGVLIW